MFIYKLINFILSKIKMDSNTVQNHSKEEINKTQLKNQIDNLKSKYILQKIFDNLPKKKSFEIIKYNKKIQKRVNIDINDYKVFREKYSEIIIEIIPGNNKYGKFINIKDKEELYYHIYFNNNKQEIKRNYITENDNVTKIDTMIDYQVKSFEKLFSSCECIESINFKKFYRNNIIDMRSMFSECSSLKEINLSNFNTNNVTDMSAMFNGCSSLKEINLSNFNTNNVTYMYEMSSGCSDDVKNKIREQIKNIKEEAFK